MTSHPRSLNRLSAGLAGWLALTAALPAAADDYHLGEGYNIGSLNIAGYSNLILKSPSRGKVAVELDDLSVFLSGHFNRWLNPFVEFELASTTLFTEGNGLFEDGKPRVVLERAYNDVLLSPAWTVRLGKMLSPVGEWNQIHAAPLVWTTTRPLTTHRNFSEFVSGASLLYSDPDGALPDFQAYYQPDEELLREPRSIKRFHYREVGGFNLTFTEGLEKRLGLSVQRAEDSDRGESQWLAGLDGRIALGKLTLESQWTRVWAQQSRHRPHKNDWGGYVQAIYGLTDQWSLVARGELFQSRYVDDRSDHWLLGVVYRPVPAMSWKMEYVETSGSQLDIQRGFYASMAVLF